MKHNLFVVSFASWINSPHPLLLAQSKFICYPSHLQSVHHDECIFSVLQLNWSIFCSISNECKTVGGAYNYKCTKCFPSSLSLCREYGCTRKHLSVPRIKWIAKSSYCTYYVTMSLLHVTKFINAKRKK